MARATWLATAHQRQLVLAERRLRPRAERQRAEDAILTEQRMAGVGLDAQRADQFRLRLGGSLDVRKDDGASLRRRAAAHRRAAAPLDLRCDLVRHAGGGVQPQPPGGLVPKEVEKQTAVQILHHRAAKRLDEFLRAVAGEQLGGDFREQPQPFLNVRVVGDVHPVNADVVLLREEGEILEVGAVADDRFANAGLAAAGGELPRRRFPAGQEGMRRPLLPQVGKEPLGGRIEVTDSSFPVEFEDRIGILLGKGGEVGEAVFGLFSPRDVGQGHPQFAAAGIERFDGDDFEAHRQRGVAAPAEGQLAALLVGGRDRLPNLPPAKLAVFRREKQRQVLADQLLPRHAEHRRRRAIRFADRLAGVERQAADGGVVEKLAVVVADFGHGQLRGEQFLVADLQFQLGDLQLANQFAQLVRRHPRRLRLAGQQPLFGALPQGIRGMSGVDGLVVRHLAVPEPR